MKLTAFSAQSNCQDTISSFITFITATRWNVKNVRIADNGMFSSVTWLRLSACSRRAEALGLDQPFKNTISEKCNEGFSLSWRWTGSAAQRSKIKVTASSWSSCWWMQNHSEEFVLTNCTFKLQDGLISFCRFMFHFKVKYLKNTSKEFHTNSRMTWISLGSALWPCILWRLASIDWLQIARLRWTIVGQTWPKISTATQSTRQPFLSQFYAVLIQSGHQFCTGSLLFKSSAFTTVKFVSNHFNSPKNLNLLRWQY